MKLHRCDDKTILGSELARMIAQTSGVSVEEAQQQLKNVIQAILSCIMTGYGVQIYGFGKFFFEDADGHYLYDNIHDKNIYVSKRRYIRFKASKALKYRMADMLRDLEDQNQMERSSQ